MPSKLSGGKRATKKKHDERDARRKRHGWKVTEWLKRYEGLTENRPTDPREMHEWAGQVLALTLAETVSDPGPSPESRREQTARIAAQFVKSLDGAKLSVELRELYEALKEGRNDAAREPSGDDPVRSRETDLI
jgi:hypothetical protein